MPPTKIVYQIVGIICMILAMLGGIMYPLNTMHILWIILYEVSIFFAVFGILYIIRREGFADETSS
jgi:ABC-type multidrug transport system permease subunit